MVLFNAMYTIWTNIHTSSLEYYGHEHRSPFCSMVSMSIAIYKSLMRFPKILNSAIMSTIQSQIVPMMFIKVLSNAMLFALVNRSVNVICNVPNSATCYYSSP
jgi:hypothetical protein